MHRRPVLEEVRSNVQAAYRWAIGRHRGEILTPSLVLDLDAAQRNIDRMAAELAGLPAGIRPHYKAHKSPDLAIHSGRRRRRDGDRHDLGGADPGRGRGR